LDETPSLISLAHFIGKRSKPILMIFKVEIKNVNTWRRMKKEIKFLKNLSAVVELCLVQSDGG
jgi:hypothetical protein